METLPLTDWKFYLASIATIITIYGYYPYFVDIFKGTTKPHLYTWVIWAITQATATAGLIYGGGMWSSMGLVVGTFLVVAIAILSLKYGTTNITKSDTITLVFALLAVVFWWQLNSPFLAVLTVSLIDGFGYIPTFRKTWAEPSSETPSFWVLMCIASVMGIIASAEYNFYTMFYLLVLAVCNLIVFSISKFKK